MCFSFGNTRNGDCGELLLIQNDFFHYLILSVLMDIKLEFAEKLKTAGISKRSSGKYCYRADRGKLSQFFYFIFLLEWIILRVAFSWSQFCLNTCLKKYSLLKRNISTVVAWKKKKKLYVELWQPAPIHGQVVITGHSIEFVRKITA